MRKFLLIAAAIALIPNIACAYTTHKVTPTVVKGVTVEWTYEFYFTKPPSKEHGSVFVEEYACQVPTPNSTGQSLLSNKIGCISSKAEADIAAGKKAGVFEWNCRHNKECDLDKIGARHKKKATQ